MWSNWLWAAAEYINRQRCEKPQVSSSSQSMGLLCVPSVRSSCYRGEVMLVQLKTYVYLQGIYVTEVHDGSPAAKSGLLMHDKILQVCHCSATFYIAFVTWMFFWPCVMNWLYINYQLWCTDYLMFLWPCIMNWPHKTTNVMHWILFIRQILLLSSTCFEYQVLIFRRT